MKKIIIFIAAIAVGITASAQQKGDFSVGGAFGVSGGSSKITTKINGNKDSDSEPSPVNFNLNPSFNYFVIDNLELNAGLDYSLLRENGPKKDSGKYYYNFTHTALFQIGAHYFVPIVGGTLYYTPGINFGFGGGSYVYPTYNYLSDEYETTTVKLPFAFGCEINLGKFEFKPVEKIGVTLNLFDLSIACVKVDTGSKDSKLNTTDFNANFVYGASVGVKYYF